MVFELDPVEDRLGSDALAASPRGSSGAAAGREQGAAQTRLRSNPARVAGIGNLLADEILWRAGLDPARPAAGTLADDEVNRLHRTIRRVLPQLMSRVAADTGDLQVARERGAVCPRAINPAGAAHHRRDALRATRCPAHQR